MVPDAREQVNGKLRLEFQGVRGLHIGSLEGLFGFVIEITSLAGHHLEGLRFRVVETENDAISFQCLDIKAESTGTSVPPS